MDKIRLKQAGAVALSCMAFLSAHAADTPPLTLKALGETRINIPQGETHAVQYWLTNHSDQTRTLSMKPIQGITQQITGEGDGDYCAKLATLKPGQSCVLGLNINTNELAGLDKASLLVCDSGANFFDDQVLASASCVQPAAEENLGVNIISEGQTSISVQLPDSQSNESNLTTKPFTKSCFSSFANCTMAMFAGGGSRTITINNTSQKVAKNLNARLPWSDVAFTNGCPAELAPGLSCMMTFSSTNSARHTVNDIVVFGSNVPESPFSVVVLGLGDTYQEGVIFQIDAGANSGKVALPEDTLTLAGATESQWSPTLDIVGTDDDNGLANTIAINDLYGTDSAAGLCFDLGTASGSQWYLPALNELDELINVALLDVQGDPFNINTQPWYWDSSEVVGNEMNEANQARFQFVGGFVDSRTQTKTNATGRVQCIHQFSN